MLSRILLFGVAVLVFSKLLVRGRLRDLGKRVDRGINVLLVAIAIVYAVQGVLLLTSK